MAPVIGVYEGRCPLTFRSDRRFLADATNTNKGGRINEYAWVSMEMHRLSSFKLVNFEKFDVENQTFQNAS